MQVIGTAGHVDHGKSTLIEALTGIHPDRLQEEREREMTIVLGFAWLSLADGAEIGIVDVPGHRDFIENMLSGIGGIDAALFVVAADEGVMPQTREHLAILDLLQIQGGVVAITKTDLVSDPEWLDLVEADLADVLAGTVLEKAPVVRVSAKTGEGIEALKQALADVLAARSHRPDLGRPRLSIDRAFTISGFGTVVTGTLLDGQIQVGDDVVILPRELKGRVRGLQTHKHKTTVAVPGSRTAINISGVDVDQIRRGDVVVHPDRYQPTRRLDVYFRLLPDSNTPIRHNMEAKLFIGASEVVVRVRLLGTEMLKPGEEGWLQLELTHPIVTIRGDRYILRRPSPGETLGGGTVVDPAPNKRHKRFNQKNITRLEALKGGTPSDILLQTISTLGIVAVNEAVDRSSLEVEQAEQALQDILQAQQAILLDPTAKAQLGSGLVITSQAWDQLTRKIGEEIDQYLQMYPLRLGMPREELKSKLKISSRVFNQVIQRLLSESAYAIQSIRENLPGVSPIPVITKSGWEIRFSAAQKQRIAKLLQQFSAEPYAPPTIKTCIEEVGEGVYNALVDAGQLIPVSAEVVFQWEDYQAMVDQVRQMLQDGGSISVAEVRDRFSTSRRYVLGFLEHLDSIGLTVRKGDVRLLK